MSLDGSKDMGGNTEMAKKIWSFAVDGTSHTVEFEQGALFERKIVRVDGTVLDKKLAHRKRWVQFIGSEDGFMLGSHQVIIYTYLKGFRFKYDVTYDLAVDGISIQTGEPVLPPLPIPGWVWPLLVLNGVIAFLGGAIPVVIGLIGTANCFRIARDPKKSSDKRIGWCVLDTVFSWMAYLVVVIVMTMLVLKRG
jgi:Fas apoptotic inhibitory molecule (FAIM1)